MLRGLLASLILHAGAGYVLVYGVPAILCRFPTPMSSMYPWMLLM